MIPPQAVAILQWVLPLGVGAAAGYGLGRLAAGILARHLLDTPLSHIVPAEGSPAALSLERTLTAFLQKFLTSRGVIYAVRDAVSRLTALAAERNVGEVSRQLRLRAVLEEKLLPALIRDDEDQARLSGILESYVPGAVEALVRWLRSAETRAVLSARGRDLLPRILEKLSELQKLFISAGQFDRRLDEKMPEIIDETIQAVERMVRDPVQQARIAELLADSARRWLAEGTTRHAAAERATLALEDDHRTVGAFFRDVFGILDTEVVDSVSSWALGFLTRSETAREIAHRVCSLLLSCGREDAGATLRGLRLGDAPAGNRRFSSLAGLFGAAIGVAVGLVTAIVHLS